MSTIEDSLQIFTQKQIQHHKIALARVLQEHEHLLQQLHIHSSEDVDCINDVVQEIDALKFVLNNLNK
jgi:hypothetical protein